MHAALLLKTGGITCLSLVSRHLHSVDAAIMAKMSRIVHSCTFHPLLNSCFFPRLWWAVPYIQMTSALEFMTDMNLIKNHRKDTGLQKGHLQIFIQMPSA